MPQRTETDKGKKIQRLQEATHNLSTEGTCWSGAREMFFSLILILS